MLTQAGGSAQVRCLVLDRLTAAARRSGGAQRYAKSQGAARGRRCCSRQPGALRLLAWAGGGGGERGGAGCARQLCQATALLSKCSAKQQTHKHRMQPSASRWWVLVRAPHSSCLVAPLLSPGAPSHMVRWWDRAGKQGRPLAGHLATGHHNGHATAFHQICARRASDNGVAHVHMSVSPLPYSGWAEPVKKNAPFGPPRHRAP